MKMATGACESILEKKKKKKNEKKTGPKQTNSPIINDVKEAQTMATNRQGAGENGETRPEKRGQWQPKQPISQREIEQQIRWRENQ